jgi:UDP-N-acetylmuramate dehydrogenase
LLILQGQAMNLFSDLGDIVRLNEPLAPYTFLRLGGPAEVLIQPRSRPELETVVRRCSEHGLPLRILGGGGMVLVRDEGVKGVVVRLNEPVFTQIDVSGRTVRAGAGATLGALISASSRAGLAGLETLVGISGTVGGALRRNVGDRGGDIGQLVHSVEVLDSSGQGQVRTRDEIHFAPQTSNLDDPVIVAAEFHLETDAPEAIVKRMRRAWIQRKSTQPLSFQAAARMFRNPRPGLAAAALITQAGLARTRVGKAEVSERDANFVVVSPGAASRDVLRLIDLVRSRVHERFHVELELDLDVW